MTETQPSLPEWVRQGIKKEGWAYARSTQTLFGLGRAVRRKGQVFLSPCLKGQFVPDDLMFPLSECRLARIGDIMNTRYCIYHGGLSPEMLRMGSKVRFMVYASDGKAPPQSFCLVTPEVGCERWVCDVDLPITSDEIEVSEAAQRLADFFDGEVIDQETTEAWMSATSP